MTRHWSHSVVGACLQAMSGVDRGKIACKQAPAWKQTARFPIFSLGGNHQLHESDPELLHPNQKIP
jgi:hypothetical protein